VDAATYIRWLITLFRELFVFVELPITLFQDNQSTIRQITNGCTFKKSKHMVIKTHFARALITEGLLKLEYVPTDKMIADAYTKPYNAGRIIRYSIRVFNLASSA
jgi:hypothetical protein